MLHNAKARNSFFFAVDAFIVKRSLSEVGLLTWQRSRAQLSRTEQSCFWSSGPRWLDSSGLSFVSSSVLIDSRCVFAADVSCWFGLTGGWFCQHHNKSLWLSRRCSSRLSCCRGCLASVAGPGRRRPGLTLATPEKVEYL